MPASRRLVVALAIVLFRFSPALAQLPCEVVQVTHAGPPGSAHSASLDQGSVAFHSQADLTGQNPDGSFEIFLYDGSSIVQITDSTAEAYPFPSSRFPSLDAGRIAFQSTADLTGDNPDGSSEIFLFDGSAIAQITDAVGGSSGNPSLSGGSIAFESSSDLTGGNPDGSSEIFLFDGSAILQITDSASSESRNPSLAGGSVAFESSADLTGENPDHSSELFLFDGSSILQITHSDSGTLGNLDPSLDQGSIAFSYRPDAHSSPEIHLFDGTSIVQVIDSVTGSYHPSLDAGSIAFESSGDLTGENADRNREIFLYDGSAIVQITHTNPGRLDHAESLGPSLDNGSIAFESTGDLTGGNGDRAEEIFLFDGLSIRQITDTSRAVTSSSPSLHGESIAFTSAADLTGENPDANHEIFLYDGSSIRQISDTGGTPGFSPPSLHEGSIAFEAEGEIFLYDGSSVVQVTESEHGESSSPSLHGGFIAFESTADFTGNNPNRNREIFLYDESAITQITHSSVGFSSQPSLEGRSIAFQSSADLTGENADGSAEIFLFDGFSFVQITDDPLAIGGSSSPSLHGGSVAFESTVDLTGENPDGIPEIFLWNGSSITQVTHSSPDGSHDPSLHRGLVAFESGTQVFVYDGSSITRVTDSSVGTSRDPSLYDGSIAFTSSSEIFLASCGPVPPPGPYLTSNDIPDFRFKVRITAGDQAFTGRQELDCIPETLCVGGALPGRSELFLRIIGPRPNGFLWTNIVRFTPSRVEVWAERISSGTVNYYDLPALPRADTELTGLVDKQAFMPFGAGAKGAVPAPARYVLTRELSPWQPSGPLMVAPLATTLPGALTFTPPAFPGYRFTVRIFSGDDEQSVQLESDCIPETVCVSGGLPGRSELFIRIIGPRPNGFLWTNIVRFTISRVQVEIEQLATGLSRTYVLDQVPRSSDQLPGRVDKEAFRP